MAEDPTGSLTHDAKFFGCGIPPPPPPPLFPPDFQVCGCKLHRILFSCKDSGPMQGRARGSSGTGADNYWLQWKLHWPAFGSADSILSVLILAFAFTTKNKEIRRKDKKAHQMKPSCGEDNPEKPRWCMQIVLVWTEPTAFESSRILALMFVPVLVSLSRTGFH